MTIVDTSVWVDYFADRVNAETEWLDRVLGTKTVGLTDLILCEILQGIRNETSFHRTLRTLERFRLIETGGADLAVKSALNYRRLRAMGHTVRTTVDCLIATVCLAGGHALLHRDRDFNAFEQVLGLVVIHP